MRTQRHDWNDFNSDENEPRRPSLPPLKMFLFAIGAGLLAGFFVELMNMNNAEYEKGLKGYEEFIVDGIAEVHVDPQNPDAETLDASLREGKAVRVALYAPRPGMAHKFLELHSNVYEGRRGGAVKFLDDTTSWTLASLAPKAKERIVAVHAGIGYNPSFQGSMRWRPEREYDWNGTRSKSPAVRWTELSGLPVSKEARSKDGQRYLVYRIRTNQKQTH